jgi:hypothetical protein
MVTRSNGPITVGFINLNITRASTWWWKHGMLVKRHAYGVYRRQRTVHIDINLKVFAATDVNEIFWGSGAVCGGGFMLKHQHTLKIETELIIETSEYLHILTLPSA